MFCPSCGQEYQDGVATCRDCGATLSLNPPDAPIEPQPEWLDLETVLETSDPALLTVARSLLEAEGIPSFARGDLLQDIVGWGRLPFGNLATGPVHLDVPKDRSAEARALLAAVDTAPAEPTAEDSGES